MDVDFDTSAAARLICLVTSWQTLLYFACMAAIRERLVSRLQAGPYIWHAPARDPRPVGGTAGDTFVAEHHVAPPRPASAGGRRMCRWVSYITDTERFTGRPVYLHMIHGIYGHLRHVCGWRSERASRVLRCVCLIKRCQRVLWGVAPEVRVSVFKRLCVDTWDRLRHHMVT